MNRVFYVLMSALLCVAQASAQNGNESDDSSGYYLPLSAEVKVGVGNQPTNSAEDHNDLETEYSLVFLPRIIVDRTMFSGILRWDLEDNPTQPADDALRLQAFGSFSRFNESARWRYGFGAGPERYRFGDERVDSTLLVVGVGGTTSSKRDRFKGYGSEECAQSELRFAAGVRNVDDNLSAARDQRLDRSGNQTIFTASWYRFFDKREELGREQPQLSDFRPFCVTSGLFEVPVARGTKGVFVALDREVRSADGSEFDSSSTQLRFTYTMPLDNSRLRKSIAKHNDTPDKDLPKAVAWDSARSPGPESVSVEIRASWREFDSPSLFGDLVRDHDELDGTIRYDHRLSSDDRRPFFRLSYEYERISSNVAQYDFIDGRWFIGLVLNPVVNGYLGGPPGGAGSTVSGGTGSGATSTPRSPMMLPGTPTN